MWKTRFIGAMALGLLAAALSVRAIRPAHAQDNANGLPEDTYQLVGGNNDFALRLYAALAGESDGENLLFSPYSVSQALAMVYAGAKGNTAEQMAQVLGFTLDESALHAAFSALNADLVSRGNGEANDAAGVAERRLNIANALWGEQTFPFNAAFIDLMDRAYNGGLKLTDFIGAPEAARDAVNQWVDEQTEGRIQDIVPDGLITTLTRMVLANAVYFKGAWMRDFNANATTDEDFYLLDGSAVTARLMHQTGAFSYAAGDGYQAVILPYQQSGMSMLVILPAEGSFETVEAGFDLEMLKSLTWPLGVARVKLSLPRFEFDYAVGLSDVLIALGMTDMFSAEQADLTGMIDTDSSAYNAAEPLFVSSVLHKAFIAVDEEGTEAAAATVVIMGVTSAQPDPTPPIEMRVDRPFLFAVRDDMTGTILFMGRVMNPTGE